MEGRRDFISVVGSTINTKMAATFQQKAYRVIMYAKHNSLFFTEARLCR
jgi:hypothetical protein